MFSYFTLLISTYWNVKDVLTKAIELLKTFNLNLLECKVIVSICFTNKNKTFNLNLLECKGDEVEAYSKVIELLISTYWNVKQKKILSEKFNDFLLISTYWNVKLICAYFKKSSVTFNLNLLECKVLSFAVCSPTRFPFNLNLLECKGLRISISVKYQ